MHHARHAQALECISNTLMLTTLCAMASTQSATLPYNKPVLAPCTAAYSHLGTGTTAFLGRTVHPNPRQVPHASPGLEAAKSHYAVHNSVAQLTQPSVHQHWAQQSDAVHSTHCSQVLLMHLTKPTTESGRAAAHRAYRPSVNRRTTVHTEGSMVQDLACTASNTAGQMFTNSVYSPQL